MPAELTGEDRCWPCTVANGSVGLLVAWLPLVVLLLDGGDGPLALAIGWGGIVTAVTVYRLVAQGYLPLAGPIAKLTGLHERIGPGSHNDLDDDQ